jgi:hypothetical protein
MRTVETELFHTDWQTDRRTDMTELIAAFRNVANAPKIDNPVYIRRDVWETP